MTRTAERFETVAMAVADMNNTTEVDLMGDYITYMAEITQCIDYEGCFYGTLADEMRWERETEEWLSKHSNNPADPNYSEIYSDVFKDLYGFRPRW